MMLSKTTESAVKALILLATINDANKPVSPRLIAKHLGLSPTYMAKIINLLVKAAILRSHRGVQGGAVLNKPAKQINLLSVIEACQGTLLAGYCQDVSDLSLACGYHQAMVDLHENVKKVLSKWTIATLSSHLHAPCKKHKGSTVECVMGKACSIDGIEKWKEFSI